jgi:hypothetical protein
LESITAQALEQFFKRLGEEISALPNALIPVGAIMIAVLANIVAMF